jgi:hypothetical protein
MPKRKLTEADFETDPSLYDRGLLPGMEIETDEKDDSGANLSGDDTGGSNPPPDKPRDD